MSKKKSFVEDWVRSYLRDEAPRSKSLMISAFGDSIAPYSDGVWLGDFIELMAPLELGERLVRTSAFRLIEEGWLRGRREGRRSYYTLTATGVRRFEAAYTHIYRPPVERWDGVWTMVLLPRNGEGPDGRIELKRELEWEGFASTTPSLMLHPGVSPSDAQAIVDRHGLREHVVVMESRAWTEATGEKTVEILSKWWDLSDVESRYERFLARFNPLMGRLTSMTLTPSQAFQVQTLLIHSFRRANLHDPRLPTPMLPPDWSGLRAYRLCRELYSRTYMLTRQHLQSMQGLEISDVRGGRLRMPVDQRFGGLITQAVAA
jgi:phenylacetic acid degradation operon negative regulatory protein